MVLASDRAQLETLLRFRVGSSRKTWISPMQIWSCLFDNGKIQWSLCFTMGKLEFKTSKYGSQDSLEELSLCFVKLTLIHQTVSTLFFLQGMPKKFLVKHMLRRRKLQGLMLLQPRSSCNPRLRDQQNYWRVITWIPPTISPGKQSLRYGRTSTTDLPRNSGSS